MHRVLMTCVVSFLYIICIAQHSRSLQQQILTLSDLPVQSMVKLNNQELHNHELNRREFSSEAPRFAHPIEVNFNPKEHGTWESVGDQAIWRLVIESKGAHSLNLGFAKFHLPSSAALYIYDYEGKERVRPFVSADNEEHEQLWTPLISGDKLIVEINIALADKNSLELELIYVNHDFMDIQKSISDACHIDIKCGEADGYPDVDTYRDQIRSIGLYTLNGVSTCTGFLINNTRQDCRPYFMTANHCNLNEDNAATMVTYWNYENSYCRPPGSYSSAEPGNGLFTQFNSGAALRATWSDSDFTLVEMDDEIPDEANAYFCGWDISSNLPSRGVVIHHPNLEEKRISFKYSPLYLGQWGQEATPVTNGNHLIVNSWDLGSTDDGSSGAPLFNRSGLAVGQLHGGLADCSNSEYDAFGRLFSSWTGGGLPKNRLKDWLDPDNLGSLILEGRNCALILELSDNDFTKCRTDSFFDVEVAVGESFQGLVELSFEALPAGAFAFYDQAFVNPGQSTTLNIANIQNLSPGSYNMTIVARDQVQTQHIELNFKIEENVASAPFLVSPQNLTTIDVVDPLLIWEKASEATSSIIQLATDINFNENLIEVEISESQYSLSKVLQPNQAFFWRIKSRNACGDSDWSAVNQFLAINLSCSISQSLESFEIIEEEPSEIFSPLMHNGEGSIISVAVTNILGSHSFVGDLSFTLISPAGTEVLLLRNRCGSFRDFDIGFADDGSVNIECPLENRSVYQPSQPLNAFRGEPAAGEWILKIEDRSAFDGGQLLSWSLEICTNPSTEYSLSADLDMIDICSNESISIPLTLGQSFNNNPNLFFETNIPELAKVNYENGIPNLILNPEASISIGNYPLSVKVNDAFGNGDEFGLDVIVKEAPSEFELANPINETVFESDELTFNWSLSTFADEYIFEIGLDENFNEIVFRDTVELSNVSLENNFDFSITYYWRIIAINRCGSFISGGRTFTVSQTNSVNKVFNNFLDIYPNPANEIIYLELQNHDIRDVDLSIHSLDGKMVTNGPIQFENGIYTLSVKHWPPGVYLVTTLNEGQVQISRIVVQ